MFSLNAAINDDPSEFNSALSLCLITLPDIIDIVIKQFFTADKISQTLVFQLENSSAVTPERIFPCAMDFLQFTNASVSL